MDAMIIVFAVAVLGALIAAMQWALTKSKNKKKEAK